MKHQDPAIAGACPTALSIVVARGCAAGMHAILVLDDCSAAMHAILVLDDCSAAMHANFGA